MSSSSPSSRTTEDVNKAVDSCVFVTSTTEENDPPYVMLCPNLQLNDRRHSEGDASLPGGSSTLKMVNRATTIDDLPDELMLEIFSHISVEENINVLREVCTRWKILAQDAHLWLHKEYVIRYETTEEEAIATIAAVPQIRTVILEKEVSPAVLETLTRSCPHLTTLKATSRQIMTYSEAERKATVFNTVCRADVRFLNAVARLSDLRVLHLLEFRYTNREIPLRVLADGCPHLCDLALGKYEEISYLIRDAEYFINSHKSVLERLSIGWTSVEGRSITPLLPRVERLRSLELINYGGPAPEDAVEALTALGQLHNLQQLHFGVYEWGVEHMVPAVFANGGLPKLQKLHLTCTVVDKTTRALAEHCPELRELGLRYCLGHTDDLFEPLHRLKKLEILKIIRCKCLSGKAMSYIAKLPALHTLEFSFIKFDKLKPSVDCILEMSGLRRLYLRQSICSAIPFEKFPGRLVNLRKLEIVYCNGDQKVLDRVCAQMPHLWVEGSLGAWIADDGA